MQKATRKKNTFKYHDKIKCYWIINNVWWWSNLIWQCWIVHEVESQHFSILERRGYFFEIEKKEQNFFSSLEDKLFLIVIYI